MLRLATSGLNTSAGLTRSSTRIVGEPPVVRFTTALHRCLMMGRNGANASGRWSGLPVFGSRACRCTIAAPASAAPMAASAISCGVIGRCGDIDGVWIAPVTAQVMMTLLFLAAMRDPVSSGYLLVCIHAYRVSMHEPNEKPPLARRLLQFRQVPDWKPAIPSA